MTRMQIARYHRVSTEVQSLDRQVSATESYIDREFGDVDVRTYTDASTGSDVQRSGYQNLLSDVKAGEIDVVVVKSISRISRSIRDLSETVDRFREYDTDLHIIDERLKIVAGTSDPFQKAMWQLLGVFAEFEVEMTRKRITEGIAARQESDEYHHGPAPLGFEKDDGRLYEAANYDTVVAVLEMVQKDNLSKRKAASRLDTSRATVKRAIEERPDLYGL